MSIRLRRRLKLFPGLWLNVSGSGVSVSGGAKGLTVNSGRGKTRTTASLPGGSEAAARLHVARTVCRRAEREAIAAAVEHPLHPLAIVYLNRLSDLLFILARSANSGGDEPLWKPGASR